MSYTTVNALFKAICDSIRTKTGKSGTINHQDIPAEIDAIETGGGLDVEMFIGSQDNDHCVKNLTSSTLTELRYGALAFFQFLETIDFPAVNTIREYALYYAGIDGETEWRFPALTSLYDDACYATRGKLFSAPQLRNTNNAFQYNNYIKNLRFSHLTSFGGSDFPNRVDTADWGLVTRITGRQTPGTLIACRATTPPTLASAPSSSVPLGQGTGFVLCPRASIATYKAATNWSVIDAGGSSFLAIEDYTTDGTLTGELDETKIDALLAS